ncbi:MAG: hypothetical protein HC887_04510 [Desulfobacteraceae bacterium]|nr:hypothetical protein [Desulfobacteraceae bacterium]
MKQEDFQGVYYKDAFANKVKVREYPGSIPHETIIETWYRLSFEDARRFIYDKDWIERKIRQGKPLKDPWIKLITHEYIHAITGTIRRHCSTSLRPYIQGYGCDGTTDLNIHAIANRLAEQHGLDYPALLTCAYPDDFSLSDNFHWLRDEDVLAETVIPKSVDADLALKDLQEINNYTLAIEFGVELQKLGIIPTDWAKIREYQNMMKQQIEHNVNDWLTQKHKI